ncbi:MFS general substrate transporter [Lentithecium fluviatile CBS 122367]|uniref:MFS general substrate transporter n=1 Tax=Lentithecium fluviatile CBS 122367 TaxID=1168545 RepID=A0A6G1IE66_9PLEO|nr:MFS general substrate transporter [Lentithecium fluviatile CBS 122367]
MMTSPRTSREEGSPLLSPVDAEFSELPPAPTPKKRRPWIFLVGLVFLLIAVIDVGAFLAEPPKTRVYESNICIRHYQEVDPSKIQEDGTVPEALCKVDAVQQTMAMIFGWQDTFDAIPGLLLAVPLGALVDRIGRKWVLVVCLMGLQLNSAWILLICWMRNLPLQLTWFSSVFYFFGGGPLVASAIGLTMIADIVPPEKRTTVFLYLGASVLIAEMLAPVMAARLMEHGDWYPLLLALGIQQVGALVAFVLPETLHLRDLPEPREDVSESIKLRTKDEGFGFKAQLQNFKAALLFLRSDPTLALVIVTFVANRLGRQALTLLIRYASKRYSWEIKKAAYLLSFRAATNLVAMTVFLPLVGLILTKYLRLPTHWADLWISRGSLLLMALSFFVLAVAAQPALLIFGLLIYNLGTGFSAAMRSVAIHVVGGQASPDIGKLMSLIAIVESISTMIAGPLLNEMFKKGMDMGETWLGLPFAGTCVIYALVGVITFIISVKERDVEYVEIAAEDDEDVRGRSSVSDRGVEPRITTRISDDGYRKGN